MLRQKQAQEEAESEVTKVRRKWGWFGKRKTEVLPAVQSETEPTETDELAPRLTALQETVRKRKYFWRISRVGTGIMMSGYVAVARIVLDFDRQIHAYPLSPVGFPNVLPAFLLMLGGCALTITYALRGVRPLRTAIGALAGTDDLRAVGPLTEALTTTEPTRSLAVSLLTRLLPRLRPADAPLLNKPQRACLRRTLKQSSNRLFFWRYNLPFATTIRRALETVGELPATETASSVMEPERQQREAEAIEALLEPLQIAVRQQKKNVIAIGAFWAIYLTWFASHIAFLPAHSLLPDLFLGFSALPMLFYWRGVFRVKAMMNELASTDDLRIVGPLIEIAATQIPMFQNGIDSANTLAPLLLTRLLPRLQASDTTLLTEAQRAGLAHTLTRNSKNPDYLVAVLKALEQVGDSSALPVVERLATGKLKTADPKRVQAAARACLPYLQTRCQQQQASDTLLRASGVFETPPDVLLRPAHGVLTAEGAELLRPEIEEEEVRDDERADRSAHPVDPFGTVRGLSQ